MGHSIFYKLVVFLYNLSLVRPSKVFCLFCPEEFHFSECIQLTQTHSSNDQIRSQIIRPHSFTGDHGVCGKPTWLLSLHPGPLPQTPVPHPQTLWPQSLGGTRPVCGASLHRCTGEYTCLQVPVLRNKGMSVSTNGLTSMNLEFILICQST